MSDSSTTIAEISRGPRNLILDFATSNARAQPHITAAPLQVARAWAQHLAVTTLRSEMDRRAMTVDRLSEVVGQNRRTLDEKLTGRAWLTSEDLVAWGLVLGSAPADAWASVAITPFPPNYWIEPDWAAGELTLPLSGESGTPWNRLADAVRHAAVVQRLSARGHLIDDSALARIARDVLLTHGLAPSDLHLRPSGGPGVFDVGEHTSVATLWGRDPESSAMSDAILQRTAEAIVALARSGRDELLLIGVLEPAAATIVNNILGTDEQRPDARIEWDSLARHLGVGAMAPDMMMSAHRSAGSVESDGISVSVWTITKGAS